MDVDVSLATSSAAAFTVHTTSRYSQPSIASTFPPCTATRRTLPRRTQRQTLRPRNVVARILISIRRLAPSTIKLYSGKMSAVITTRARSLFKNDNTYCTRYCLYIHDASHGAHPRMSHPRIASWRCWAVRTSPTESLSPCHANPSRRLRRSAGRTKK